MPQIDVYTAQSKPAVPDQPMQLFETGERAQAARQIEGQTQALGNNLAEIGGRINQQTADIQFMDRKQQSEAAADLTMMQLQRDPEILANPSLLPERYAAAMKIQNDTIAQTLTNDEAKAHFDFWRRGESNKDYIKTYATSLKMQDSINMADYASTTNKLALQAASAIADADMNKAIDQHEMLVTNLVSTGGVFTPKWGEQELIKFRKQVAAENMAVIGGRDPSYMRSQLQAGRWPDSQVDANKKRQILEHVNEQQRIEDRTKIQQQKDAEEQYFWGLYRLAAVGALPDGTYADGISGADPMMQDPRKWEILRKKNAQAPAAGGGAGGEAGIAALRLSYDSIENPKKSDWEQGKKAINLFMEDSNPSMKTLNAARMAVEHFQSQIDKIESEQRADERMGFARKGEARAEVTAARQQKNDQERELDRKIQAANDIYLQRNNRVIVGRGMAKTVAQNKVVKEKAMLRTIIRQNPNIDPNDAVDRVLGKNVGTVTGTTDTNEEEDDGISYLRKGQ